MSIITKHITTDKRNKYMPHSHDHSGHAGYNDNNSSSGSWLSSRTGIIAIVAAAILGLLIYNGNGSQLLGYWPFLLIGACLLSHVFMHGGHGGHQHGGNNAEENTPRQPESQQQAVNAPQAADTQKPGQQAGNNNQPQHQHKHGGC